MAKIINPISTIRKHVKAGYVFTIKDVINNIIEFDAAIFIEKTSSKIADKLAEMSKKAKN